MTCRSRILTAAVLGLCVAHPLAGRAADPPAGGLPPLPPVTKPAVTPTTEVRGRLVGPRCPGVTTIEVAYPLRPFPCQPGGVPPLSRRVVIPEPSLWEPQHPFVYRVVVELWEGGQRCDQRQFDYGLRMADGGRASAPPQAGRS